MGTASSTRLRLFSTPRVFNTAVFLFAPGLVDYCASKHGAVGFEESLRMEIARQGKNVHSTVVCPYFINTGMFDGVQTRCTRTHTHTHTHMPVLQQHLHVRQLADQVNTYARTHTHTHTWLG